MTMSRYDHIPQTPSDKLPFDEDDILDSLNIPSTFDLELNDDTSRTSLSSSSSRNEASSPLLEQHSHSHRRLSNSISRSPSPSSPPHPQQPSQTWWKSLPRRIWEDNQGVFLVTASQLFGALMNVTTRLLELEGEGMHPFQILFARQSLTALFCSVWMWWSGVEGFPLGKKGVRGLLYIRAFTGFFGIFGMYYSLQYLPLADATVITFLAPAVASYGCHILLNEPFPKAAQYASFVSLLGVVLIARPSSFFTSSSPATPPSEMGSDNNATTPIIDTSSFPTPTVAQNLSAILLSLIGVMGSAGAFTSIRYIGTRAHPLLSVNYFSIFCALVSLFALLLPIPYSPDFKLPDSFRQWGMLLFLGVCGFVMQYLLTKGLGMGGRDGGRGMNMIYSNMVFAVGLDRVVFGIIPGWWSVGGGALVVAGCVWGAVSKGKAEQVERGVGEEEMGMLRREEGEGSGSEDGRGDGEVLRAADSEVLPVQVESPGVNAQGDVREREAV